MPLAAEAQPLGKVYRIGFLSTDSPTRPPVGCAPGRVAGARVSRGQNLVFERRFSEGNAERFPELAAELVRLRVDSIIVPTAPAAIAARNATQMIPIVIPTCPIPWERGSWRAPRGQAATSRG